MFPVRNKGSNPIFLLIFLTTLITACSSVPQGEDNLKTGFEAATGGRFIRAAGVNIHYTEAGDGDIEILMLHGMLGNTGGWDYIIPELSKDYRVAAYDRPAFGYTERPPVTDQFNAYTPEEAERQALEMIKALDMERPVLLGHSAGGNLALRLAIDYPEMFRGLILISPGVYTEIPPALIRELLQLGLFQKTGIEVIRSIPERLEELLEQTYFRPDLVSPAMRENYLRPTGIRNWDQALLEYTRAQDDSMIAPGLYQITVPVLIIQGIRDRVVPASDNLKAAEALPNARLIFLENCGHAAHEEKPEAVINAVREFISGLKD